MRHGTRRLLLFLLTLISSTASLAQNNSWTVTGPVLVNLKELAASAGHTRLPSAAPAPLSVPQGDATSNGPAQLSQTTVPKAAIATQGTQPSPTAALAFTALGDNDESIPPDTQGAVGPNHLVVALNTQVRIQDKYGHELSTLYSLSSLWAGLGVTDAFDPRTLYDPYNDRWIIVALKGGDAARRTGIACWLLDCESAILIAVSVTGDPLGTYSLLKVNVDPQNVQWADYPNVGFNKKWLVVSVNMFTRSDNGFTGSSIFVFSKSGLYAGATGNPKSFYEFYSSIVPAVTYDNSIETEYLVQTYSATSAKLRIKQITGQVGSETYPSTQQIVNGTDAWADIPSGNPTPDLAPQLGSTQKIDAGDSRLQNVIYRDGALWCVQTVFLPASNPTRSSIQWWQVAPSGIVGQLGRIDDPTGIYFYARPSMAVNKNDDVLIGYSRFAASEYAGAFYAYRQASDPPGVMRADALASTGKDTYYKTFSGTKNRWGDYSSTTVDPTNDTDFWTIQEYAEAQSGSPATSMWGTYWAKIIPVAAPAQTQKPNVTTSPVSAITATAATLSGTVNANGSDTQVWFRYGTDPGLVSNVNTTPPQDVPAGTSPVSFSTPVTGLAPGTTYYAQANASNSVGVARGSTVGFVTTTNTTSYTLTVIDSGQGTVFSSDGKLNCNYNAGSCTATYSPGTVVTLYASNASGWTFTGWGGACSGTNSCNIVMNSNQYAYAQFTQNNASYTLNVSEIGQGTVTSNVGGISCVNGNGSCQATYTTGTSVTLTATPAINWAFSGWSGASCGGASSCNVVVNDNQSVTATFSQTATSYTLTVADSGQGTITSADTLINCVSNIGPCFHSYPSGSVVNLTATPATGWAFSGWSGFCSGTGPCAVAMTAARSVTANFVLSGAGFTITGQVSYDGAGLGGVTVSLTGSATQSVTTVASGNYSFPGLPSGGYSVTASLAGYTFDPTAWSVDLGPLNPNVAANFTASKSSYALAVSESGQGTVTSADGTINCKNGSGTCSSNYTAGTVVTLNASPASGWQFYGWTGPCNGTGSCIITLNSRQTVAATFSQSPGPLVALPAFTSGIISTIAGQGTFGYSGDGSAAINAALNTPLGVAVDSHGTVFIADFDSNRIRAVNTTQANITITGVTVSPGTIATIAGTGTAGFSGDGGAPINAQIWGPTAIAVDSAGNLYISDTDNSRIRVINMQSGSITAFGVTIPPGTIKTVAGNGTSGYSGDGGAATLAALAYPQGLSFDSSGNLLIADWSNNRVRQIAATTGTITTIAGGGHGCAQQTDGLGDGCPSADSTVILPVAVAVDTGNNVFISETGNRRIRAIYKQGTIPGLSGSQMGYIYTLAGAGSGCAEQTDSAGDGCPAANIGGMLGVGLTVDLGGSIYFADYQSARLRRIDRSTGIVTTLAGNGTPGYSGDNGLATSATLAFNSIWYGNILAIDSIGNIYFGDGSNNRVRTVSAVGAPMTFPSTEIGQISSPQQLSLRNVGNAALLITGISITGSNAADFAQSSTCPVTPTAVAPGGSCTISITFSPTQQGNKNASLVVWDNAGSGSQIIPLAGATPSAPIVATASAASITANSASLLGTVTPNGLVTNVWFRYGTDPTLSSGVLTTDMQIVSSTTGTVTFNANVASLTPSRTYYFQANASNSAGSSAGGILSFPTPASAFSISGQITLNGSGFAGVRVLLNGVESGSVVTDSTGHYSLTGLSGEVNYTISPSLPGYNFTPSSFSFGVLSTNQNANFSASVGQFLITLWRPGRTLRPAVTTALTSNTPSPDPASAGVNSTSLQNQSVATATAPSLQSPQPAAQSATAIIGDTNSGLVNSSKAVSVPLDLLAVASSWTRLFGAGSPFTTTPVDRIQNTRVSTFPASTTTPENGSMSTGRLDANKSAEIEFSLVNHYGRSKATSYENVTPLQRSTGLSQSGQFTNPSIDAVYVTRLGRSAPLDAQKVVENTLRNAPVLSWSKVSGPGEVTFSEPSKAVTEANFSRIGTYVLSLTSSAGSSQISLLYVMVVVEDNH